MSREVIDTIEDIDGCTAEVGFDDISELPFIRCPMGADFSDEQAERFSKAWNEALLRRERAKAANG